MGDIESKKVVSKVSGEVKNTSVGTYGSVVYEYQRGLFLERGSHIRDIFSFREDFSSLYREILCREK